MRRRTARAATRRLAGIGGDQPLGDGAACAIARERRIELALQAQHVADLLLRQQQAVLPARVLVRSAAASRSLDGEADLVARERLVEVALGEQDVADLDGR